MGVLRFARLWQIRESQLMASGGLFLGLLIAFSGAVGR
jgi:hypothetical protein